MPNTVPATGEAMPNPRPLNLQLLDLGDNLNMAFRFAQAIEMAAHALGNDDERAPMIEIVSVLVERLSDLQDELDGMREELA